MIVIKFHSSTQHYPPQAYQVAGHTILSNRPVAYLESFQKNTNEKLTWNAPAAPEPVETENSILVYHGPGWLANRNRNFLVIETPTGCILKIAGLGSFFVGMDGKTIHQLHPPAHVKISQISEALIGPCLILALAFQGTWCFHASAVKIGEKLVLFLGASGFGKSTLAGFLNHSDQRISCRYIDDILPANISGDQVQAHIHYPQLKIDSEHQPSYIAPSSLPISAVYALAAPSQQSQDIIVEPYSAPQTMRILIQNTVAARLFTRNTLREHMDFCTRAAQILPARLLSFPRKLSFLPAVEACLLADLDSIP